MNFSQYKDDWRGEKIRKGRSLESLGGLKSRRKREEENPRLIGRLETTSESADEREGGRRDMWPSDCIIYPAEAQLIFGWKVVKRLMKRYS